MIVVNRTVRPLLLFIVRENGHRALCPFSFQSCLTVYTTPEEFKNGVFALKTHKMFSVHTTPEEFKNNGVFALKTHQMFSVHTTLEEFKNGVFTLKTHQIFSVHTTPEEFEIYNNDRSFRICV